MATLELIADVLLLLTALTALLLMLRRDARGLQQAEFETRRFYGIITEREEYMTVPRIALLVVLIASATTMAIASPYVVLILALVLAAVDVAALRAKPDDDAPQLTAHSKHVMWATLALVLVAAAVAAIGSGLYYGAVTALALATFSYAPTVAVNWLWQLATSKNN